MVVVEVMGRDAGWIAYASGVAGGAHVILVPEKEIDIDHVCALLKYNYDHGKHYGVVVVAEGCHLPEVGQVIDDAIDMVHDQKWGRIAVLKGTDITDITIKEAIATNRRLDKRFFDVITDLEAKV